MLFSACAAEELHSYPLDAAPMQIIHTQESWYALLGRYGRGADALAVGPLADQLQVVHEIGGANVWFLDANDEYAAWCEQDGNSNRNMVYSRVGEAAEQIHTAFLDAGFQPGGIGVYGACISLRLIMPRKRRA